MPEEEPEEKAQQPESNTEATSSPRPERARLKAMTPELRRFLGTPRSRHDLPAADEKTEELPPTAQKVAPPRRREPEPSLTAQKQEDVEEEMVEEAPVEAELQDQATPPPPAVQLNWKLWRVVEMQKVVLIIGAILMLLTTFYVGRKIDYWRYLIRSRQQPQLSGLSAEKYPGLSADELVEQGLAAQRLGNWREAVERFVAAKQRNLTYRGILFRAGKICYDHGDFDNADKLLERAIAFGEDVANANYLRGLIAVGHSDLPAAQRFFEAAANADPFTAGYYYYWAEALRRDHRPQEAARRYEQASRRATSEQDATVCRFKIRMTGIEAGEGAQLKTELEKKRTEGPLSVDWLLTEAALKITESDIADAVRIIEQTRAADEPRLFSLFASCTTDMLFVKASRNHPEVAQALKVGTASASPTPAP